jgi:hypothetical protein
MDGMEFTWRMVGTLVWPFVIVLALIVYREWITEKLLSARVKFGSVEGEVKVLNTKVDTVGRDVGLTLSEAPRPAPHGEVPESLVDLMPVVNRNRSEGIHEAFGLVRKALQNAYPQLLRVPPAQLAHTMQGLVDKGIMDADVALSVKHLYELLEMPEWNQDLVGDTRGYAFLMLAEGAIHGILRSTQAHRADAGSAQQGAVRERIRSAWHGTYNGSYPIELRIRRWQGLKFRGDMTYPESDNGINVSTVTDVQGEVEVETEDGAASVRWEEQGYLREGHRSIDFSGYYSATVKNGFMNGGWYQQDQLIARFKMEATDLP